MGASCALLIERAYWTVAKPVPERIAFYEQLSAIIHAHLHQASSTASNLASQTSRRLDLGGRRLNPRAVSSTQRDRQPYSRRYPSGCTYCAYSSLPGEQVDCEPHA